MAWNDGLTGQALNIASSDERRIRVIAGPGSGKTFSLMRRIARLLETGNNPSSILLATFTRTAAHDLKQELQKLGAPRIDQIDAGTLHSFCFRILRNEAVLEITGREPRPLFNFERDFVIADLMTRLTMGKREVERTLQAFESAWARLQSDEPGWPSDENDRRFQQTLVNYLRFHKAMLIGEVIPLTLGYLRNNPAAEEFTRYANVFVDEYQDLNRAEQELMNLIAKDANMMVIGDEDQSIYESFRNAHPEGIRLFHELHNNAVDFPLSECRRCPTGVIAAADSLIHNNTNREQRSLIARDDNPEGTVHRVQWQNFESECEGVVSFVRQRINEGVIPGKILIMCPQRKYGYAIRDALQAAGINAHSFFTEELFENDDAKMAMSILNLLVNRNDRVALRSALGIGVDTKNSTGYKRIHDYCESNGAEPFQVLEKLCNGEIEISYTQNVIARFQDVRDRLDEFAEIEPIDVVSTLFPASESWTFPFNELWEGDEEFEQRTLEDIRQLISTQVINPDMPVDVDYVRVMSLHKSKGLTADLSIITGVIEGLIPRVNRNISEAENLRLAEEQRRLFYVAITRHKSEILISSVREIPKELGHQLGQPVARNRRSTTPAITSTFLSEMERHLPVAVRGEQWNP